MWVCVCSSSEQKIPGHSAFIKDSTLCCWGTNLVQNFLVTTSLSYHIDLNSFSFQGCDQNAYWILMREKPCFTEVLSYVPKGVLWMNSASDLRSETCFAVLKFMTPDTQVLDTVWSSWLICLALLPLLISLLLPPSPYLSVMISPMWTCSCWRLICYLAVQSVLAQQGGEGVLP